MSSPMPSLLAPADAASVATQPSRAASAVVAKPARGFLLFRIDGYSWTRALPGGECISSDIFFVGGRPWVVDFYPNGVDASRDSSDSVAVYLRLVCYTTSRGSLDRYTRVRAQFKFSLLNPATGAAAYERPAETAIFTKVRGGGAQTPDDLGCGCAEFIYRQELERRSEILIQDDCLVIRCDVGVTQVAVMPVGSPKQTDSKEGGTEEQGTRKRAPDEEEFIRRCLRQRRT